MIKNILKVIGKIIMGIIFFSLAILLYTLLLCLLKWLTTFNLMNIIMFIFLIITIIPCGLLMFYTIGDSIVIGIKSLFKKEN